MKATLLRHLRRVELCLNFFSLWILKRKVIYFLIIFVYSIGCFVVLQFWCNPLEVIPSEHQSDGVDPIIGSKFLETENSMTHVMKGQIQLVGYTKSISTYGTPPLGNLLDFDNPSEDGMLNAKGVLFSKADLTSIWLKTMLKNQQEKFCVPFLTWLEGSNLNMDTFVEVGTLAGLKDQECIDFYNRYLLCFEARNNWLLRSEDLLDWLSTIRCGEHQSYGDYQAFNWCPTDPPLDDDIEIGSEDWSTVEEYRFLNVERVMEYCSESSSEESSIYSDEDSLGVGDSNCNVSLDGEHLWPAENLPNPAENLPNPVENLSKPAENLPNPVENLSKPAESLPNPVETLPAPAESLPNPVEPLPMVANSVSTKTDLLLDIEKKLKTVNLDLEGRWFESGSLGDKLAEKGIVLPKPWNSVDSLMVEASGSKNLAYQIQIDELRHMLHWMGPVKANDCLATLVGNLIEICKSNGPSGVKEYVLNFRDQIINSDCLFFRYNCLTDRAELLFKVAYFDNVTYSDPGFLIFTPKSGLTLGGEANWSDRLCQSESHMFSLVEGSYFETSRWDIHRVNILDRDIALIIDNIYKPYLGGAPVELIELQTWFKLKNTANVTLPGYLLAQLEHSDIPFIQEIDYMIGHGMNVATHYEPTNFSALFRGYFLLGDLDPDSRIKLNLLKSLFDRQLSLNGKFPFPNLP